MKHFRLPVLFLTLLYKQQVRCWFSETNGRNPCKPYPVAGTWTTAKARESKETPVVPLKRRWNMDLGILKSIPHIATHSMYLRGTLSVFDVWGDIRTLWGLAVSSSKWDAAISIPYLFSGLSARSAEPLDLGRSICCLRSQNPM